MNNEKKYREIAKFCMKQKADENIAKEYENGMKDARQILYLLGCGGILDPCRKPLSE